MRAKPTTAVPHVTEQSAEQPGTSAPTSNENQERLDMSDEGKVQVTLVRYGTTTTIIIIIVIIIIIIIIIVK